MIAPEAARRPLSAFDTRGGGVLALAALGSLQLLSRWVVASLGSTRENQMHSLLPSVRSLLAVRVGQALVWFEALVQFVGFIQSVCCFGSRNLLILLWFAIGIRAYS